MTWLGVDTVDDFWLTKPQWRDVIGITSCSLTLTHNTVPG